jgi:hypothetical protein
VRLHLPDSVRSGSTHLPRHVHIAGRPLWHVPDPEHEDGAAAEGLDFRYLHGRRVYFHVSRPKPVECHIYTHPPLPGHDLLSAQRGLSILTMCWSYILSVRFLELQRRKPSYSQHLLLPVPVTTKGFKPSAGECLLDLGASASPKLVRWLCANASSGEKVYFGGLKEVRSRNSSPVSAP